MKIIPEILKGTINIPSSKSETHRAIICAGLAKGNSKITNVTLSEDITATINGLINLGADITIERNINNTVTVKTTGFKLRKNSDIIIDCNESGSTLRFLIPLAVSLYDKVRFIGRGGLEKRPLSIYFDLFDKCNIEYSHGNDYLPLDIKGKLDTSFFELAGNVSSQFVTGVMIAAGLRDDVTEISIVNKLESKPYVDITQDIMDKFGVKSEYSEEKNKYTVYGGEYAAGDFEVKGDWSHAGFLLLAGTKSKIALAGLSKESCQGDKIVVDILKSMGAKIYWENDLLISEKSDLHAGIINVSQCPDLAPVVGAALAVAQGEGKITGGERLRIKESDRIKSVADTICRLGGQAEPTKDGMIIKGRTSLSGGNVSCYNDHRIAMMIGALSVFCSNDIIVEGHECVAKSYPQFWDDFSALGGKL